MSSQAPIGIFDSGIGGLTVLSEIRKLMPHEELIYFADSANLPYGEKPMEKILELSKNIVELLRSKGCKLIVIACNTASAAALKPLRELYPDFPFVGMEPAVKPAAEQTKTKTVGVLATPATFQGELYASVVERFAQDVEVIRQPCPGLVQQIEAGKLHTHDTEGMLRGWIEPMLEKNIDTLVLGCTHYPFVKELIKKIAGEKVRIIDPAPAVAKQVQRILEQKDLLVSGTKAADITYFTSGSVEQMKSALSMLDMKPGEVIELQS
ncbi:MAG: glutamate racemase [Bacteroidia bacterium]|nr:glutamate racemase [Bacteroidia bacterium]